MRDIALKRVNGIYDLCLDINGDLSVSDNLDNAIITSLLTDSRADSSEVTPPHLRRGWWAEKSVCGKNFGSKLWLLDQARSSKDGLQSVESYARTALQWLLDDGFVKNINLSCLKKEGQFILKIGFDGKEIAINLGGSNV